jgi:hypothetical protein
MMKEAAVVIDIHDQPLYWHLPAGRSASALPDSRALWLVLWDNRERLAGVAHTHPAGIARPSATDIATFVACEAGLGRRLSWWIVTPGEVICCCFRGPDAADYAWAAHAPGHAWLEPLRGHSWAPEPDREQPDP